MNWLTTIWTSFITLALALSAFHLVRWLRRREWLYLLFVLLGVSIAAQAAAEIWMFRATSIQEYGLALRWFQVPIFFAFCMVVGIIHRHYSPQVQDRSAVVGAFCVWHATRVTFH